MKENELLYYCEFPETVEVVESDDNMILLSNKWSIDFYHDQDCCENVWADCQNIHIGMKLDSMTLKKVDGMGILFNGQLICCYNEQNGYYSDILEMTVRDSDGNRAFSCSDVPKEDKIY